MDSNEPAGRLPDVGITSAVTIVLELKANYQQNDFLIDILHRREAGGKAT